MPIPKIPDLIFPHSGSVNQLIPTSFVWEEVNKADSYNLQISEDYEFVEMRYYKMEIVETSEIVNGLDNNKTYYWRVSATNNAGTSGYSEIWPFSTKPEKVLYRQYEYRVIATPDLIIPQMLENERLVKLAIEHSQQWPFRVMYVWVIEKEK